MVEPQAHADPELKSARRYANLSAAELRQALIDKGSSEDELPSERTLRDILNRKNYRLKRLQKRKPLKKPAETDAIFAHLKAVREQVRNDPGTLEIAMNTNAKVTLGAYARGGKTRTDGNGGVSKGWDHGPPAQEEPVLFGNLMLATGAWMLLFGSRVTSAAWVDALRWWWRHDRAGLGHVRRPVVSPDNGPKNPGRRAQFVERMVQCADWSGLEIRLVCDPPYPSRYNYNPIERCWSALEERWDGVLLNGLNMVLQCALRMSLEGIASDAETSPRRVSGRRSRCRRRGGAVRGSIATFGDFAEIRPIEGQMSHV
ncbi:MAG TPA: hypothetical protein VKP69_09070, partial [Isosphaeraceae bacterium]|nr:hypothetical protein [Isosphaeraceae bacterium]